MMYYNCPTRRYTKTIKSEVDGLQTILSLRQKVASLSAPPESKGPACCTVCIFKVK